MHSLAIVTLGMKNMMGGILPKSIVDLNRKFKPRIGIIDGVIGCQTHEIACDPVPSDLIVAVDTIGTYLIGINPKEVKYLELAKKAGLGENRLYKIKVIGAEIKRLQKKYKRNK